MHRNCSLTERRRIHRRAHHSVVKVGKEISTTCEKWAPKNGSKWKRHYLWDYSDCTLRYLFSISWRIPRIIFAAVDLYFTVIHWCFCPAIFLSFIIFESLFLCICLNTVLFHLSYAFPLSYCSESCASFLERTLVTLFKPVLEVKSQRQFQLLKTGLSFISYFSSFLSAVSSIEKGTEDADLLPARVPKVIVCFQVCFFPNLGNKCSCI